MSSTYGDAASVSDSVKMARTQQRLGRMGMNTDKGPKKAKAGKARTKVKAKAGRTRGKAKAKASKATVVTALDRTEWPTAGALDGVFVVAPSLSRVVREYYTLSDIDDFLEDMLGPELVSVYRL